MQLTVRKEEMNQVCDGGTILFLITTHVDLRANTHTEEGTITFLLHFILSFRKLSRE